jgi:hypothetical protein
MGCVPAREVGKRIGDLAPTNLTETGGHVTAHSFEHGLRKQAGSVPYVHREADCPLTTRTCWIRLAIHFILSFVSSRTRGCNPSCHRVLRSRSRSTTVSKIAHRIPAIPDQIAVAEERRSTDGMGNGNEIDDSAGCCHVFWTHFGDSACCSKLCAADRALMQCVP